MCTPAGSFLTSVHVVVGTRLPMILASGRKGCSLSEEAQNVNEKQGHFRLLAEPPLG